MIRRILASLCILCSLALSSAPSYAGFTKITQLPKDPRWPYSDADPHGTGFLKAGRAPDYEGPRLTVNNVPMPAAAKYWLDLVGWDGTPLTTADVDLLFKHYIGHVIEATYDFSKPPFTALEGQPAPTPAPPPTQADVPAELYPAGHEISARYPQGTKARRAIGAFETAWSGVRAFSDQATFDGVPASQESLQPARDALLVFYNAVVSAYQNGEDTITNPAVIAQCKAAGDAFWDTMHAARKAAKDAKASGFTLVVGDPRPSTFNNSRLNRIAWTALLNLTTAEQLYGINSAKSVNAFESFNNQDPLRGSGGTGGIATH